LALYISGFSDVLVQMFQKFVFGLGLPKSYSIYDINFSHECLFLLLVSLFAMDDNCL